MIFLVIPLFIGNHFNDKGNLNAVFTGFLFGGFAVTYICHHFYKKHKEAIRKYQIYKKTMKLTETHIKELYTFTRQHYVYFYDVQTELVDHLANDIENIWIRKTKFIF